MQAEKKLVPGWLRTEMETAVRDVTAMPYITRDMGKNMEQAATSIRESDKLRRGEATPERRLNVG